MQSRFGIVTDAFKRPIYYNHEANHHTLKNGIIASKNKRLYEVCDERIEAEVGQSVGES